MTTGEAKRHSPQRGSGHEHTWAFGGAPEVDSSLSLPTPSWIPDRCRCHRTGANFAFSREPRRDS